MSFQNKKEHVNIHVYFTKEVCHKIEHKKTGTIGVHLSIIMHLLIYLFFYNQPLIINFYKKQAFRFHGQAHLAILS